MPQFDLTTYSSQIFWFAICFLALYFSIAKIILPRISSIIANRKSIIDADTLAASALESEVNEFEDKRAGTLSEANAKYKSALEAAQKNASAAREKMLEEFKDNSAKMVEKSRAEINKIINSSKEESNKVAAKLAADLEKKIFNS